MVLTANQSFADRMSRLFSTGYTIMPSCAQNVGDLREILLSDCPAVIVCDCHGVTAADAGHLIGTIANAMYVSGRRPAAVLVGVDDIISVLVPDDGFFGYVSAAEEDDRMTVRRVDTMAAIQQIRYGEGGQAYIGQAHAVKKRSGFVGYMRDKLAKLRA